MIQLRDYQQDLYRKAQQSFARGNKRILIVAPCGAGKSYLFLAMCESAIRKNGNVLVLCHRKELMQQHIDLFKEHNIDMSKIRVALFWSEINRLGQYEKPTLIIADEVHWLPSTLREVLDFYNCYTVGMTATPVREDDALSEVFQDLIVGVDVNYLIEHKRLSPFNYYSIQVANTLDLKSQSHGDYVVADIEKIMMKPKIYSDVIESYEKYALNKKTIIYCASVKHSQEVAESFCLAGYKAAHMDANTPKQERLDIMNKFRSGEIKIICNVMLIVEGISVPDCECCILLRPTQSLSIYIQSSMRCMRYQENKTAIIIDCVANYLRHGLPNEEREWSLDKPIRKKEYFNAEGEFTIRTCQNCFRVFKTAPVCPYCGEKYITTERELKEMKEIELERISEEEAKRLEFERKKRRQEQGQCKTIEQLTEYGIKKGMNRFKAKAWAKHVFEGRKK